MSAFIITSISLAAAGGLFRLVWLAVGDYPRTTSSTRGGDAFGIVLAIAWCSWGIWLVTR